MFMACTKKEKYLMVCDAVWFRKNNWRFGHNICFIFFSVISPHALDIPEARIWFSKYYRRFGHNIVFLFFSNYPFSHHALVIYGLVKITDVSERTSASFSSVIYPHAFYIPETRIWFSKYNRRFGHNIVFLFLSNFPFSHHNMVIPET
jgi:hypothetical protein